MGVKQVVPAFFELASFLFRSMEAGERLVVAATRRPVNVGLGLAVAVRTGPPEALRGFSRVSAAPGVDPGEATSPRSSATLGPEWTPKLVEERKL